MARVFHADIARCVAGLLAMAFFAGCATGVGRHEADGLDIYEAHAGASLDSFRLAGSLNGWTPLGDRAVALWTHPGEAYLVDLQGSCPDITYAPAITVTSRMGRVSARFDKVVAQGGGSSGMPCVIAQIRQVDVRRLRAAQKAARDQDDSGGT